MADRACACHRARLTKERKVVGPAREAGEHEISLERTTQRFSQGMIAFPGVFYWPGKRRTACFVYRMGQPDGLFGKQGAGLKNAGCFVVERFVGMSPAAVFLRAGPCVSLNTESFEIAFSLRS